MTWYILQRSPFADHKSSQRRTPDLPLFSWFHLSTPLHGHCTRHFLHLLTQQSVFHRGIDLFDQLTYQVDKTNPFCRCYDKKMATSISLLQESRTCDFCRFLVFNVLLVRIRKSRPFCAFLHRCPFFHSSFGTSTSKTIRQTAKQRSHKSHFYKFHSFCFLHPSRNFLYSCSKT